MSRRAPAEAQAGRIGPAPELRQHLRGTPPLTGRALHRSSHCARFFVLAGILLVAGPVRADRKETFAVLGFDAGANRYKVPANGSGNTTAFAGALDLSLYYGLSNTLHVGGRLRVTSTSNVHFDNAKVTMPDGSESVGSVFVDHRSISLGAVGLYRFDTGVAFAPVIELEAGFAAHQYQRIEHVPAGAGFKYELGNKSQNALYGAGALLLEYRFANRWVAMTGVSVRAETGDLQPWSLSVPLRVGVVW